MKKDTYPDIRIEVLSEGLAKKILGKVEDAPPSVYGEEKPTSATIPDINAKGVNRDMAEALETSHKKPNYTGIVKEAIIELRKQPEDQYGQFQPGLGSKGKALGQGIIQRGSDLTPDQQDSATKVAYERPEDVRDIQSQEASAMAGAGQTRTRKQDLAQKLSDPTLQRATRREVREYRKKSPPPFRVESLKVDPKAIVKEAILELRKDNQNKSKIKVDYNQPYSIEYQDIGSREIEPSGSVSIDPNTDKEQKFEGERMAQRPDLPQNYKGDTQRLLTEGGFGRGVSEDYKAGGKYADYSLPVIAAGKVRDKQISSTLTPEQRKKGAASIGSGRLEEAMVKEAILELRKQKGGTGFGTLVSEMAGPKKYTEKETQRMRTKARVAATGKPGVERYGAGFRIAQPVGDEVASGYGTQETGTKATRTGGVTDVATGVGPGYSRRGVSVDGTFMPETAGARKTAPTPVGSAEPARTPSSFLDQYKLQTGKTGAATFGDIDSTTGTKDKGSTGDTSLQFDPGTGTSAGKIEEEPSGRGTKTGGDTSLQFDPGTGKQSDTTADADLNADEMFRDYDKVDATEEVVVEEPPVEEKPSVEDVSDKVAETVTGFKPTKNRPAIPTTPETTENERAGTPAPLLNSSGYFDAVLQIGELTADNATAEQKNIALKNYGVESLSEFLDLYKAQNPKSITAKPTGNVNGVNVSTPVVTGAGTMKTLEKTGKGLNKPKASGTPKKTKAKKINPKNIQTKAVMKSERPAMDNTLSYIIKEAIEEFKLDKAALEKQKAPSTFSSKRQTYRG
jgi:hypothetical protein